MRSGLELWNCKGFFILNWVWTSDRWLRGREAAMGDSWEEEAGSGANGGGALNPNAVPFQVGKLNVDAPAFVPQSAVQPPEPMQDPPQESGDAEVENGGNGEGA